MQKWKVVYLFILMALVSCGETGVQKVPGADLVIKNANIWTGDSAQPWVEAMAIRDKTIVLTGTNEEVSSLVGTTTAIIDSPPGMVVPGFIDSHVHFLTGGFSLSSVKLRDAQNKAEFVARIKAYAETLPPGDWIQNGDWDHENWGGELPSHGWVDDITLNNPLLINRLDGHMMLANAAAMKAANVTADTPDVEGGEIVRDKEGNPTGIFKDNAMDLILRVVPSPTAAQLDNALEAASRYVASQGVTSVHDMSNWQSLATFRRAARRLELKTRIYQSVPLKDWQRLTREIELNGRGDNWLRIGGLKGFMDGSLGSHTAAFFQPFTDTPSDRGFFINDPADMAGWINAADEAGLQVLVHAIGDRAISTLLDIYADVSAKMETAAISENENEAGVANSAKQQTTPIKRDRRFRIEHAQHIDPQDFKRFFDLNVIASMQPYHAIDDGRWAEKVIGAERAKSTYAFKSLLGAGVKVAFGSDWFVAPPIPLLGIYAAVTRSTLDEANPDGWIPAEKITVEEALTAYTSTAAYASFEENIKGQLKPGLLADFVILNKNLTEIPAEEIRDTLVMRTVIGGKTVYQRDKYRE
jgi:predicted amidohydrolase YtcJ